MAVKKNTWVEAASTSRLARVTSRTEVRPLRALATSPAAAAGTPQPTTSEHAHSMRPAMMKERRNPSRDAVSAPTGGPSTCPSVMLDWIASTSRRTSVRLRPAMMKAKVDTAPMSPSKARAKNISGRVRASAMNRKPSPWSPWTRTKPCLGSRPCTSRPEIGAVTIVISGLIPRIQPVHRSVAVASNGDMAWM